MSTTILFNEGWYLDNNPDVMAAVQAGITTAWDHFQNHGKFEGRSPSPLFDPQAYLAANPDVAAAVGAGHTTAYDHFAQYGGSEGRSPASWFDPGYYLAQNPDVAAAVAAGQISAVDHFLQYGQFEGRQITPFLNVAQYLQANPDVASAAGAGLVNPLEHLFQHGLAEGRDLGNGVDASLFADDPFFQAAIASGNVAGAMARVQSVAPFLPDFEPAPGWQLPEGAQPPANYTPPPGVELVVPDAPEDPSVPDPEPDPTPDPDPDPTPDPDPDPAPDPKPDPTPDPGPGTPSGGKATQTGPTFRARHEVDDDAGTDTITFSGNSTGPITVEVMSVVKEEGNLTGKGTVQFTRNNINQTYDWWEFGKQTIDVSDGTVLTFKGSHLSTKTGAPADETGGRPAVWLDYGQSKEATLVLDNVGHGSAFGFIGASLETLTIEGSVIPKEENGWGQLQIWDGPVAGPTNLTALDKLVLNVTSNTDLGAYQPLGILTKPTDFDASGSMGGIKLGLTKSALSGLVNWQDIKTGGGDDLIALDVRVFKESEISVNTGAGDDTLELSGKASAENTISIAASGDLHVDASALKVDDNKTTLKIAEMGTGAEITVKLAEMKELVPEGGNWYKDDLEHQHGGDPNGPSSNHKIVLGDFDKLNGGRLIIENFTVSKGEDEDDGAIINDTLDFTAWFEGEETPYTALAEMITQIEISQSIGTESDGNNLYIDMKVSLVGDDESSLEIWLDNIMRVDNYNTNVTKLGLLHSSNGDFFNGYKWNNASEEGHLITVEKDSEGGISHEFILDLVGALVLDGTFTGLVPGDFATGPHVVG